MQLFHAAATRMLPHVGDLLQQAGSSHKRAMHSTDMLLAECSAGGKPPWTSPAVADCLSPQKHCVLMQRQEAHLGLPYH
jgi:hypothetical protein